MARSDDTLIAAVDGAVYPLSNSECIFRARESGEKHVMTMQVLRALDLCSHFRTLDGHVQAVMRSVENLKGREDDVRRVLSALDKRGLFISAQAMLEQARAREPGDKVGVRCVFIRSNGRGTALEVLLNSLAENERRHTRQYRYYILDDASSAQGADADKAAVAAARSGGLDCHWLGRDWQADFAAKLIERAGADADLVNWALRNEGNGSRFTGGRLCNLITLASAGKPFLMLDDDLVCDARTLQDAPELRVNIEDWELWFHADAAAAREWGRPVAFDPLWRYGAALGRPTGAALDNLDLAPASLAGLDQRKLYRALNGPVLSSVSGTYGDAASANKIWLYTLTGESRERFWGSREVYERSVQSRYVTRVRGTLSLQSISQFTSVGLAGQWMLPPTLPFGRNEDSLAATTRHCLYPDSFSLEFPWALGHFPEGERRWESEPWDRPYSENLARFIGACLLGNAPPVARGDTGTRYALLAGQLNQIAAESNKDLLARLDEFVMFVRSDVIAQLQKLLTSEIKVPVYWGADVRRIVEVNGKALAQGTDTHLEGMPADLDDGAAAAWLRGGVSRFAQLLEYWPRLWRAAREMDALPD